MSMMPRLSDGPERFLTEKEQEILWKSLNASVEILSPGNLIGGHDEPHTFDNRNKPCQWDVEQWAEWQAKEDEADAKP